MVSKKIIEVDLAEVSDNSGIVERKGDGIRLLSIQTRSRVSREAAVFSGRIYASA